jgi:hypothetical protein
MKTEVLRGQSRLPEGRMKNKLSRRFVRLNFHLLPTIGTFETLRECRQGALYDRCRLNSGRKG